MHHSMFRTGLAAALLAGVAASVSPATMTEAPRKSHRRTSGSKPVSGGGSKERQRRLARLSNKA